MNVDQARVRLAQERQRVADVLASERSATHALRVYLGLAMPFGAVNSSGRIR